MRRHRTLSTLASLVLLGAATIGRAQEISQTGGVSTLTPQIAVDPQEFARLKAELSSQSDALRRQQERLAELERQLPVRSAAAVTHSPNEAAPPPTVAPALEPLPAVIDPCEPECEPGADGPLFRLGGQYRVLFNGANFDYHSLTIDDSQPSQSFLNQRFRTWLTVVANEQVEGYMQAEVGHIVWGDDREFPKAFSGPRFPPAGDDRLGVELRRGYLSYMPVPDATWRLGIQDWQDSFGQTLASSDWDFNVGGLSYRASSGDVRLLAGTFVLWEGDLHDADDALLFTADLDCGELKGDGCGVSVYFLPDHDQHTYPTAAPYDSAYDFWLGVRGRSTWGALPLNAFFIYNPGWRNELDGDEYEHNGFAVKLEAGPLPALAGHVSAQSLYSNNEFRTVAQSERDNFGGQGYWSYLAITSPHGPSDVNDLGVSLQNRELGLFTVQGKYEYDVTPCLAGAFAVGWLRSTSTNPVSGATDMGTELVKMFTRDFGGGLKWDLGVAVLFTGDFYKPSHTADDPDTLWEVFSRVQLEF